jgi:glycosyltransferase involved in cell wall biosynthesis
MINFTIDDVTVVVIGKNEESNLSRCFESVKKVTNNIVFVDSNSSDNSIEVAKKYDIPVIVVLDSNFYSASLGRSVGATKVNTKLIQFLDGDMELDPEWLLEASNFMNKNVNIAVVHGFKKEFKKNTIDFIIKSDYKDWRADYIQGAYLIQSSVYEQAGGLDPRFPGEEERDLYVRIHELGYEAWYRHKLMASHYDFKDRGWKYLLFSDVAGAISVPLVKSLFSGRIRSYIYVYRRLLLVLSLDLISLIAILSFTWVGLGLMLVVQLLALGYVISIKRPGYFIIWKSALINIHRTVRILNRNIDCKEQVIMSDADLTRESVE